MAHDAQRRSVMRTDETVQKYRAHKQAKSSEHDTCFICNELSDAVRAWVHWIILPAAFPYDAVAGSHDMLIPKRHIADSHQLNTAEREELEHIKQELTQEDFYNALMENFTNRRSHHSHYHLLRWHH